MIPGRAPIGSLAGTKRTSLAESAQAWRAKVARVEKEPALVVYSTSQNDDLGILKWVGGEYAEEGVNHGRKCYQRITSPDVGNSQQKSTFLYFWDDGAGAGSAGWWIGSQVGGEEVWLHNRQTSVLPPRSGWIWRDGQVKREFVVASAAEKRPASSQSSPVHNAAAGNEAPNAPSQPSFGEWRSFVQPVLDEIESVESTIRQSLQNVKAVTETEADASSIEQVQAALNSQVGHLLHAQQIASSTGARLAQVGAPPGPRSAWTSVSQRLFSLRQEFSASQRHIASVIQEQAKKKEADARRAEEEARLAALEPVHAEQVEEIVRTCTEKVDTAEDEVEKTVISATALETEATEDLKQVMLQAIQETEQRCRVAQSAIGEVRRLIALKTSQVSRFAPGAKKTADGHFTALNSRVNDLTAKLQQYTTVRQDFEQSIRNKKIIEELYASVAEVEVMVEEASAGKSLEEVKKIESAISRAQVKLSQAFRLIDTKLKIGEGSKGRMQEDLQAVKERAQTVQDKLSEVSNDLKQMQARAAAEVHIQKVMDKASIIDTHLAKLADAEFSFGSENDSQDDTGSSASKAALLVKRAQIAFTESRVMERQMLAEAARTSPIVRMAIEDAVMQLQQKLDEGENRLQQFKSDAAVRQQTKLVQDMETAVGTLESQVQAFADAVEALDSASHSAGGSIASRDLMGNDASAASDALKQATQQVSSADAAVQTGLVAVQKRLVDTSAELRKLDGSHLVSGPNSEIGRLQARISSLQTEAARLRVACKGAEESAKQQQQLVEVVARVREAETEVENAVTSAASIDAGILSSSSAASGSTNFVRQVENQLAALKPKLAALASLAALKLKTAHGAAKEELENVGEQIAQLTQRLEEGEALVSRHRQAQAILEAEEAVAAVETDVQKLAEATESLNSMEEIAADGGTGAALDGARTAERAERRRAAFSEVTRADRAAQARLMTAQKLLSDSFVQAQKTGDSDYNMGAGGDLERLQERLSGFQTELGDLRLAAKGTEERARVQEQLADVTTRVQSLEQETEQICNKILTVEGALIQEDENLTVSVDELTDLEQTALATKNKIGSLVAAVAVKLKGAQGTFKEQLDQLASRLRQLNEQLIGSLETVASRRDKTKIAQVMLEARKRVEAAEEALIRAASAGKSNSLETKVASAPSPGELVATARRMMTDAVDFTAQALVDLKDLKIGEKKRVTADLMDFRKRLEVGGAKLAKMVHVAFEEKVSAVEQNVKRLADILSQLENDKLKDMLDAELNKIAMNFLLPSKKGRMCCLLCKTC